jgi:hypothetical protein
VAVYTTACDHSMHATLNRVCPASHLREDSDLWQVLKQWYTRVWYLSLTLQLQPQATRRQQPSPTAAAADAHVACVPPSRRQV